MRYAVAVAMTLCCATGCTTYRGGPTQWTRPGLDPLQLARDEYVCDRDADRLDVTPTLWPGGLIDGAGLVAEDFRGLHWYRDCMTTRGYVRSGGS
jgi:hypothetical protein